MTGETLNHFIRRARLERAASLLMDKRRDTIADIALSCGFSGNAAFSRAFREYFSMSPTSFRNGGYKELSKIRKLHGNLSKINTGTTTYFRIDNSNPQNSMKMKVEVKNMPAMRVAYVRHTGSYNTLHETFEKLMRWAGPRGLIGGPENLVMAVYHDDPGVTEEQNLRTSICVTIPENLKIDGEFGSMQVAGGTYACGHFELSQEEFTGAWTAMMRDWLPESGYVCDDKPPYELYLNDFREHPQKKHIVRICIPVKPV